MRVVYAECMNKKIFSIVPHGSQNLMITRAIPFKGIFIGLRFSSILSRLGLAIWARVRVVFNFNSFFFFFFSLNHQIYLLPKSKPEKTQFVPTSSAELNFHF